MSIRLRTLAPLSALALLTACGDDDPKPADTAAPDTADVTDTASETADTAEPPDVADTAAPGDTDAADTDTPIEADAVFAFRAAPGQSISDGPFPNDGLFGPDGTIDLAPLGADPRFGSLAKPTILERTNAEIDVKRGFGFVSSVFFPMNAAPDLSTFAGAVHFVALSGPEQGKVFPGTASWFSHADYLSVFPAWGQYLVPGSKYAVVVDAGVKTADGRTIAAPPAFAEVIAAEVAAPSAELTAARAAFADLRAFLATRDQAAVIGTVFTTEATMPFVRDLFAAVDAFALVPPTAALRVDGDMMVSAEPISGAALDDYFGVPAAPFLHTPTPWSAGPRANAAKLPGGAPYTGGSFHGDIGLVVSGSFLAPAFNLTGRPDGKVDATPIEWAGGAPVAQTRAMIPFTAFLCRGQLTDGAPDPAKTVPFAVFTHGGTAMRSDALPFAVANCAAGYATISFDLPFHGGRQDTVYLAEDDVVAPSRVDDENVFSGKKNGEDGFVPDHIGDNGGATTTVGGMFGLASNFDPDVIEANLISVATDAYTLVRYLEEPGPNGLGAFLGTRIDTSHLVMESLSFGTSFTSALMAGSTDFVGAVQSVGSGGMISLNLPMAPNNAVLAGGIVRTIYGLASSLAEINAGAHTDPMVAMLQWLSQRGDPAGYAPFVLRHREDDHVLHVFGSGDSWDETLHSPAQMTFNAAWGVPTFTAGPDWTLDATIPGADTVQATPYAGPISGNLTYGTRTQSAAYFYNASSCHAQVITPICESGFEPPYPPNTPRATPVVSVSPLCALQAPVIPFLSDLLAGEVPSLTAPGGTCADLYAP